MKKLYKLFSSIKLTIILTYVIVGVTVAGSFTLLFKKARFETIDAGILIDWLKNAPLSASWWILLLIALIFLFAINTAFCTFDRIYGLVKSWRGKEIRPDEEEESVAMEDMVRHRGIRFKTLLPYIAHIGFLIALAGHLTGSLLGFRGGDMMIPEGGIEPIKKASGYALKAGKLEMEIGKRGYPEKMSAQVSLLFNGEEVRNKVIEINSPLIYGTMAVYIKNIQTFPEGIRLRVSGNSVDERFTLSTGESRRIGNSALSITGGRIDSRYGVMEVMLWEKGKITERKWLSPYNRRMQSARVKGLTIQAEELSIVSGGIFTVNKDPGLWLVFGGLTLFILPLSAHLFFRNRK